MASPALTKNGFQSLTVPAALPSHDDSLRAQDIAAVAPRAQAELARQLLPHLGLTHKDLAAAFQLAEAVAKQRSKFNRMVVRCQRHFSEESVHNARVSCRRLIARLLMVKTAAPDSAIDKVLRQLRRFLKSLGALRDVQVQKQHLTEDLQIHHEIAGLWIELGQKELDLIESVQEKLSRFKLRKINRRIRAIEQELTDPTARLATKATLCDSVVHALAQAYAEVVSRKEAIDPAIPATVHQTRIAYKKYRYMVESLPPAVCRPSAVQLSAMAEYQTAMGIVQDTEVSMAFVDDYANRFPLVAADLERYQRTLAQRMQDQIRHFLDVSDALASFWPLETPLPNAADAELPAG